MMRLGIRLLGGKVHPKPALRGLPSLTQPERGARHGTRCDGRRCLSGTARTCGADAGARAFCAGLPWWVAIGGSAVALRVAIPPTVLYQVRQTRNSSRCGRASWRCA